jgi:1,4-dihydroxy-2-naphthoate octaprenyltransferase
MIKAFIKAARLRTLPLSVSGIVLAGFLADFKGVFRLDIALLSLVLTIAFQVLSNFANDYGDGVKGTDNDLDRIGPKRALQSGAISQSQMKKAIIYTGLFSFVLSLVLIFTAFDLSQLKYVAVFIILGGLSIWAAIKYTVGESAYGYRGMGDLFVFLFFGLLSVIGGYFLYDQNLFGNLIYPAAAIGLLATAVLNLNNMRDQVGDKNEIRNKDKKMASFDFINYFD